MDPREGTFLKVNADPDLTSEFTHFNEVIHLSKLKRLAFPLLRLFPPSRCSCRPLRTF